MAFSITAELPLGTYRGRTEDGGAERIPSVARLYSALLCAAGFGPRARERDGELGIDAADEAALRWVEANPPDAVSIPPIVVNQGRADAYRHDGTIKRTTRTAGIKKFPKPADASVAVNGCFRWTWTTPPPQPVIAALQALCPDVPYLGTTESPVRLSTDTRDPAPSHLLDPHADAFSGHGEDLDVPTTGRLDELRAAHRAVVSKIPNKAKDKITRNEWSSAPAPPRLAVTPARYMPVRSDPGEAPWPDVLVLPLSLRIDEHNKVRWASAAHRALISTVGDGAPPLLTGVYPEGVPRPVNRLALQVLNPEHRPDGSDPEHSALVVLIPRGADAADVEVVIDAVGRMPRFRGPRGAIARVSDHIRVLDGSRFWPRVQLGSVRLWRVCPAAVPDTRGEGPDWTFAHAALLSLGFVWRGSAHLPEVPGRGGMRYRGLVDAVNASGAAVVAARPLRTTRVDDYAHRVHQHAVVRPYQALLSVGVLGAEQTLQAIGQSRHLGGGLLVPYDVPEGAIVDDGWATP